MKACDASWMLIQSCDADIVLMQETYGSGPRISARLGFDYFPPLVPTCRS